MSQNQPKRRWLKPIIALIIIAAFTTWFIPWANRRMNTMPPTLKEAYSRLTPISTPNANEATTLQILTSLNTLGTNSRLTEQPPKGMKWSSPFLILTPHDVINGKWQPDKRPNLRAHIKLFESQQGKTALDQLAEYRETYWGYKWVPNFIKTAPEQPSVGYESSTTLSCYVLARVRYHYAHCNNVHYAWDDLKTCFWLAKQADYPDPDSFNTGMRTERKTYEEIIRLSTEKQLPTELAREIYKTITARQDPLAEWKTAISCQETIARTTLATNYADTPDEDGWLVLGQGESTSRGYNKRSRLWNLATICHHNHKTVDKKLCLFFDIFRQAASLEYSIGIEHIKTTIATTSFDKRNGNLAHDLWGNLTIAHYQEITCVAAYRNAALVALALNQYHEMHGDYPEELPTVIDGWNEPLPLDPFSGKPFAYRRKNSTEYELWSVGINQKNDNGNPNYPEPYPLYPEKQVDIVFTGERTAPTHEAVFAPL